MDNSQATIYLASLLGKMLSITTTDKRMFLGQFKCTDSDLNIVLSQTSEYRLPQIPKHAVRRSSSSQTPGVFDLSSRYLGLVIIPGKFVTKIEVEEFASQMRKAERSSSLGMVITDTKQSTQISAEDTNHIVAPKTATE
ncbi:hypothetical protein K3495_g2875 [Podosphaera aphanis]|nr:hypothetical protein K3495_g2875 [Podosphaera aphanis]